MKEWQEKLFIPLSYPTKENPSLLRLTGLGRVDVCPPF